MIAREPTHRAMTIMRRMIADLEALNNFKLGPISKSIIQAHLVELESAWDDVDTEWSADKVMRANGYEYKDGKWIPSAKDKQS